VTEVDGIGVSVAGDYHETLVFVRSNEEAVRHSIEEHYDADQIVVCGEGSPRLVRVSGQTSPDPELLEALAGREEVLAVHTMSPVLPVRSRRDITVPFLSAEEMVRYNETRNLSLWELALRYECARGDLAPEEVLEEMGAIVRIMRASIQEGLAGTEYSDRILGPQAGLFQKEMEAGRLLEAGALNRAVVYVTAVMEVKSSMGVIVAAPTAGSCGALPGACFAVADDMNLDDVDLVRAMLAAGIVGVFIQVGSTFAAESCGCQAETGAGAAMTAAALATMARGSADQALSAASMALQNTLGLICDPVANRVEVPCLGRNVTAAANGLASANMALAGFDAVIPLDEVIQAMSEVGASMPAALRCTALGGLSITPTSKAIEETLGGSGPRSSGIPLPVVPDPGVP
jgi:L-serine dehydratase